MRDVEQRAIAEGADFIESDITATKDGKLICFHDLVLDYVTDVADHAEFANRIRTYEAEGEMVTGYFSGNLRSSIKVITCSYHSVVQRASPECHNSRADHHVS